MINDEEDIINFEKNCSNISISDSMSVLNENASTYMGVKTIPEGTIPDNNEEINHETKKRKKQNNKKIKRKKYSKTSSISSSSSSSSESYSSSLSSSSSYISSVKSDSYSDCEPYNALPKKKKNNKMEKEKNIKEKNAKEKNVKEKNKKIKNVEKEKKKEKIIKNNEIETKFEWDEKGDIIYVTGSFCDWNKFFLMTKNNDGKYSIILPLPRGFHQYKFKVDGIWTYSQTQPKFEDNGNVNNYIDTRDYYNLNEEKEKEKEKEKSKIILKKDKEKRKYKAKEKVTEENKVKKGKKKSGIKLKIENKNDIIKHKRNSSLYNIHFLNSKNQYSTYYPPKEEFNKKPSALPGLYKTYYILNENKNNNLKLRKFSQIEYVDNTNNSIHNNTSERQSQSQSLNSSLYFIKDINPYDPYVKFQNLYHIHSNHLHTKEATYAQNTVTSIISRYRFKYSTFIYYKENNPIIFGRKKHSKTINIKREKMEK